MARFGAFRRGRHGGGRGRRRQATSGGRDQDTATSVVAMDHGDESTDEETSAGGAGTSSANGSRGAAAASSSGTASFSPGGREGPAAAHAKGVGTIAPPPPPPSPSPTEPPVEPPLVKPQADPDEAEGSGRRQARHQRRRRRFTRVTFVVVLVALVAAIPALGLFGRELVLNSEDGRILNPVKDPTAPGYQALLESTPTALLVQTTPDGEATSATLLALGTGDAGGSVLFIPLDTATREAAVGVDRLSTAFTFGGLDQLRGQTGLLLGVGIDEAIAIDDEGWAELIRPLGSITIENPDTVVTEDGTQFPNGLLELQPDEVGPFLVGRSSGESDLNRLVRQRLVWDAWLKAVAFVGPDVALQGASPKLAPFIRTLSQGTVEISTLAVVENDAAEDDPQFLMDPSAVAQQVYGAVPFPRSPAPGARVSVRLLNGVEGAPVPGRVADALVRNGGEITTIGNARELGQEETRIEYYRADEKGKAELMRAALGLGELTFSDRPDESVAVTVVVGADLYPGSDAPDAGPGRAGD